MATVVLAWGSPNRNERGQYSRRGEIDHFARINLAIANETHIKPVWSRHMGSVGRLCPYLLLRYGSHPRCDDDPTGESTQLLIIIVIFFVLGIDEASRLSSKDRLTQGQCFFSLEASLPSPDGATHTALGFGCSFLWNCHDSVH